MASFISTIRKCFGMEESKKKEKNVAYKEMLLYEEIIEKQNEFFKLQSELQEAFKKDDIHYLSEEVKEENFELVVEKLKKAAEVRAWLDSAYVKNISDSPISQKSIDVPDCH